MREILYITSELNTKCDSNKQNQKMRQRFGEEEEKMCFIAQNSLRKCGILYYI